MPSFRPLYHWEGVVEEVTGETFRARLLPFEHGLPMRGKVEFTEFRFDELSEESDRALVEAGAVFSWTIGKAENRAGQLEDVSLVRFRAENADPLIEEPIDFDVLGSALILLPPPPEDEYPAGSGPYGF